MKSFSFLLIFFCLEDFGGNPSSFLLLASPIGYLNENKIIRVFSSDWSKKNSFRGYFGIIRRGANSLSFNCCFYCWGNVQIGKPYLNRTSVTYKLLLLFLHQERVTGFKAVLRSSSRKRGGQSPKSCPLTLHLKKSRSALF